MSWIGKIIGGTVGFMLGGPLGLIAGAVFGNMFDNAPRQSEGGFFNGDSRFTQGRFQFQDRYGGETLGPREQAQMVFFVGAFSMLACIARADGEVSAAEQRKVEEFIRRDLRLDPQSSAVAMKIFETAGSSPGSFDQYAAQFYENFHNNRQMLELMIDMFYRVSFADGAISSQEEHMINRAGRIFSFSSDHMHMFSSRYSRSAGAGAGSASDSAARSYAVLGLKPQATDDEVKKAYRKLVSEYHPDKIASKGLPEEFVTFASDKFREIQGAYETVSRQRGL